MTGNPDGARAAPRAGKLPYIDLLRGLSALYIVGFWHLMNYTEQFPGYANALTHRTTVVVLGLFVFLSGHLLGQSRIAPGFAGLKRFLTRRLLRIYPLYLAALALFVALDMTGARTALKAALALSPLLGPPPQTLWFIATLLLFYLIAPALIRAAEERARSIALSAALALLFALAVVLHPGADPRLAIYFPAFALGIHCARNAPPRSPVLWLALPAALALSFAGSAPAEQNLYCAPLACIAPLAIYLFTRRVAANFPRIWIIEALSYASYAMYLFHRPLYQRVALFADGPLGLAALVLVGLPATIAVSWLIQKAYDHSLETFSFGDGDRSRLSKR